MSFDWSLYIQLADELINNQRTQVLQEAYLRSAISRSYYGVFCIARNSLVRRGVTIPRVDTHKFVREKYLNSSDKAARKIGNDLRNLWKERKDADYEDGATVNINRAKTAYIMANRLLNRNTGVRSI